MGGTEEDACEIPYAEFAKVRNSRDYAKFKSRHVDFYPAQFVRMGNGDGNLNAAFYPAIYGDHRHSWPM